MNEEPSYEYRINYILSLFTKLQKLETKEDIDNFYDDVIENMWLYELVKNDLHFGFGKFLRTKDKSFLIYITERLARQLGDISMYYIIYEENNNGTY